MRQYEKIDVESLIGICQARLPLFQASIHVHYKGGGVAVNWNFNWCQPQARLFWDWMHRNPKENCRCGTYPTIRAGIQSILNRLDRYELEAERQKETARKAKKVAAPVPKAKPEEPPEEEDSGLAEELEPIVPLPEEPGQELKRETE
jgi:hypothetical protein